VSKKNIFFTEKKIRNRKTFREGKKKPLSEKGNIREGKKKPLSEKGNIREGKKKSFIRERQHQKR
jgi:hypothetical protein